MSKRPKWLKIGSRVEVNGEGKGNVFIVDAIDEKTGSVGCIDPKGYDLGWKNWSSLELATNFSDEERLVVYEKFLHAIQMHADVTMDHGKLGELIRLACDWSYAHRQGNGEYTEEEQQGLVDAAFQKIREAVQ